jgi:hypothetical protein
MRPPSSALFILAACALSVGCAKSHAAAPRPDLSGVWDVTYDDFLVAELRLGEHVHRTRLAPSGGRITASLAGVAVDVEIDCSRDELVCPSEVWPAELALTNRIGDLDDDGTRFSLSLAREGRGACVLQNESLLHAEVESLGSARDGSWQATALSRGQVTTTVRGLCLDVAEGDLQVRLSAGLSAVRR